MSISAKTRKQVRQIFDYRCGYCGIPEHSAGSELEIDHFQPKSCGGTDDLENLVYCCPACNRFKQDYWPGENNQRRLLHPLKDKLEEHLIEDEDGLLIALSDPGAFHIQKLRLNRPQLRSARVTRRLRNEIYSGIDEAVAHSKQLDARDSELSKLLNVVFSHLQRLRNL